jgi:hypothetical protein
MVAMRREFALFVKEVDAVHGECRYVKGIRDER